VPCGPLGPQHAGERPAPTAGAGKRRASVFDRAILSPVCGSSSTELLSVEVFTIREDCSSSSSSSVLVIRNAKFEDEDEKEDEEDLSTLAFSFRSPRLRSGERTEERGLLSPVFSSVAWRRG
jgi:hypothetical protein